MNQNDIQTKIDDLRAKMADATGDEKAKYQAEIDKLQDELKSNVQNIGEDIKNVTNI